MSYVYRSESIKINSKIENGTNLAKTTYLLKGLARALTLVLATNVNALPVGGNVTAGKASIEGNAVSLTITQLTPSAAVEWQAFNIESSEAVRFAQPSSSSVTLNRVIGSDSSRLLGSMSANGRVFLVNPNGILFGNGAQVNVGGLVASTLNITDSNFMSGTYKFFGTGAGSVLNQGAINTNTDGGYVALLGGNVSNMGIIAARLGAVTLAAGAAITLDMAGDGLLNVTVSQGSVKALVQNGGMIQADGGEVLLTTQAAGSLLQSAVNNTGAIQAQTIDSHGGTIKLLADMQSGTVNVGGVLSARGGANSGDGGFIETSASHVVIASNAKVDTLAPFGKTGLWLLDPVNYTISATGGDETPASVTASLAASNRFITASNDITVVDAVSVTSPQTLTLNAGHDVIINAPIVAVPAGAGIVLIAGNNVNVNAALTVTGAGSSMNIRAVNDVITFAPILAVGAASPISISAGNDITANATMTAVGAGSNINLNAGRNVSINAALAASAAGSSISMISGLNSAGPGIAGGTVALSLTGTVASNSTSIRFNPTSYANTTTEISAYNPKVTGILDAKAWVYLQGNNKIYDGTNAATLSFMGNPSSGGSIILNAGAATFDTKNVGKGKAISFNGASIGGIDANKFALFTSSVSATANITPATLTATAANASKTYGQTMTLSAFTVVGLARGETIGAFTETSPGTSATASVGGSPYAIVLSSASGGSFNPSNYTIVYVNGALTVTPQPVVAMSFKSVAALDSSPMSMPAVALSQTQSELKSLVPADVPAVEIPESLPRI
jgi:filamentous hemagglutinin family protein